MAFALDLGFQPYRSRFCAARLPDAMSSLLWKSSLHLVEQNLCFCFESIRDLIKLQKRYGAGRWRKLKGFASVRTASGRIRPAEIHWYEAHGIGKVDNKIKPPALKLENIEDNKKNKSSTEGATSVKQEND